MTNRNFAASVYLQNELAIVISGPSGVGKGTLVNLLIEANSSIAKVITCTTRAPRDGEINGVNYHFKTIQEFYQMIQSGEFLEYAEVHGKMYGTPLQEVNKIKGLGKDALLEIDVQGAVCVKEKLPDAIMIFIAPPSIDELERRLRGRATDSEETIALRIKNAVGEIEYIPKYDYLVVNADINTALEEIQAILHAEHLKIRKTKPCP